MWWLTIGLPTTITAVIKLVRWVAYLRWIERVLRDHGAGGLRQATTAVQAWPRGLRPGRIP